MYVRATVATPVPDLAMAQVGGKGADHGPWSTIETGDRIPGEPARTAGGFWSRGGRATTGPGGQPPDAIEISIVKSLCMPNVLFFEEV